MDSLSGVQGVLCVDMLAESAWEGIGAGSAHIDSCAGVGALVTMVALALLLCGGVLTLRRGEGAGGWFGIQKRFIPAPTHLPPFASAVVVIAFMFTCRGGGVWGWCGIQTAVVFVFVVRWRRQTSLGLAGQCRRQASLF